MEKQYVSRFSGVFIPLPVELVEKYQQNFIKFKTADGSIFRTEHQDLQEVIEGVPLVKNGEVVKNEVGGIVYKKQPNTYWKKGVITILPTKEELAEQALKAEQEKHAGYVKRLVQMGMQLPDDSWTDSDLREFAKSIGVQTADTDGNKLKKVDLVSEIWAAFNLEYTKQKGAQSAK
jgi:hypothetical protein